MIALLYVLSAPAVGEVELGVRWTGTVAVLPALFELERTRLSLDAASPEWSLRAQLDWSGDLFSGFLGVIRLRTGKCSGEGRAAFSPYPRSLLSLERGWQGVSYPQAVWLSPAPHLRYGWIRAEVSAGRSELSVRLHHRVHHGWDVERLAFLDVVAVDEEAGRWRFTRPELEVASRVAFVARGLRVIRTDGGSYTDRYSLALSFEPRNAEQPLHPAPEARAYLDARVGQGWNVDEVFLQDAFVYFQYPYRTEVRLRWDEALGSEDLRITSFWEDRGLGFNWREAEIRLRGLSLGRETEVDVEMWAGREGGPRLGARIEGGRVWGRFLWEADIEWEPQGGRLELSLDWEEQGHVRAHVRPEWEGGAVTLAVYGVSVECILSAGWNAHGVVAFERPPARRPAWYRNASFRRLHGTWSWEDGRWAVLREGESMSLELGVYTATVGEELLSITRWFVNVEVELVPGVEVETSWVSGDPTVEHSASFLDVAWSMSV